MSGAWVDVSATLREGMAHWPGDAPYERRDTLQIASGDVCNLSHFSASVHTGTHMDAPRHFIEGGLGMDRMPLEATVGPARVIAIEDEEAIRIAELEPYGIARGERILFRTRNSGALWKTDEFARKFVHIPRDTAAYLAGRGVRTVGIDYLSVGAYEGDGAEAHRALLGAGIWVIEGLRLEGVAPGNYELVCLPLKLAGADGAPARAILRPI